MLTLKEQCRVVNLYEELGSYRAVAALVGCDHKTVKATLERAGQAKTPYPRRTQLADPYLEMIANKVDATEGRIHGKAMLRILRAAGYRGSSRTLFRVLKVAKKEWGMKHMRPYRPWVSAPGDFLIVDFGEVGKVKTAAGERRLFCFCAVLGYSRWRYVRFLTGQRLQVLAQGLAGCFDRLGGVPAHVMFDNPKPVTNYFVAGLSVLNAELARLAAHYHFTPLTAAAADPESKGKVEALVRYVKSDCVPGERMGRRLVPRSERRGSPGNDGHVGRFHETGHCCLGAETPQAAIAPTIRAASRRSIRSAYPAQVARYWRSATGFPWPTLSMSRPTCRRSAN